MLAKTQNFFRAVKAELKKTTWPSKQDSYGSTLVVVVFVLLVAVYLWLVDTALSRLIRTLLST
jgi:preprotein translocase subunit SecE